MSRIKKLIPAWALDRYHRAFALGSAAFYGFPSRKLTVIGVTGTNGKSSVVWLLARMLEEGGLKVAASSSIEFQVGETRFENKEKMTMPGRGRLQKLLADAVRAGCTHAVVEVTSEGITQHRHEGIDFDVAVFLNLAPEHIERHGSYEAYRKAKEELFKELRQPKSRSGSAPGGLRGPTWGHRGTTPRALRGRTPRSRTSVAGQTPPHPSVALREGGRGTHRSLRNPKAQKIIVVNIADSEAAHFLQYPADTYIGFRTEYQNAAAVLPRGSKVAVARNMRVSPHGIRFTFDGVRFVSPLRGATNVENLLACAAIARELGVKLEDAARAAKAFGDIPGRLERIENKRGMTVIVDYAHTPSALERVYQTLHGDARRMICVLGSAGGGRDHWKRPKLGKLAGRFCTIAIVTDEDPYDEDPQAIRKAVLDGIENVGQAKALDIADRREAIQVALKEARPGDTVVITGKGSESWMVVAGGKKVPWDDRKVVREELAGLTNNQQPTPRPSSG